MTHSHWLLYILSACLYAAPVLSSSSTWPFVFVFPIPLLYIALYNNLSWWQGFLWGIIAFGIHTSGVFWGIDTLASGSIIARIAPSVLIVSYLSIYACAWFGINSLLIKMLHLYNTAQRLILWVLTYWLFILFMEHYCLTIFGRPEGYFLFNPLFVLAEKPQLLTLLPYLGKALLLLLIIVLSGALVYAYIRRTTQSYCIVLLCMVPWLISLCIPIPDIQAPVWLSNIAHVPVIIKQTQHPSTQVLIAQELFKQTLKEHPHAQLLISPESSILCSNLSTLPSLYELWSERALEKPVHIIVGAFRWDGPHHRNTLHWFYNGKLQQLFDKRHAMLLTEHIPSAFKINMFEDLFFTIFPGVVAATAPRPVFTPFDGVAYIPYICSELFFNDQPDDDYPQGSTILATTSDAWCAQTNIAPLMHLAARLRAIQWQRNILYISYLYTTYYDIYGNKIDLKTNNVSVHYKENLEHVQDTPQRIDA